MIPNGHSMKVKIMKKQWIEGVCDYILEDLTLEEFFEQFNLTPYEIIELAYENGLLDEKILKRMAPVDV